jgi:hypothetical protein
MYSWYLQQRVLNCRVEKSYTKRHNFIVTSVGRRRHEYVELVTSVWEEMVRRTSIKDTGYSLNKLRRKSDDVSRIHGLEGFVSLTSDSFNPAVVFHSVHSHSDPGCEQYRTIQN